MVFHHEVEQVRSFFLDAGVRVDAAEALVDRSDGRLEAARCALVAKKGPLDALGSRKFADHVSAFSGVKHADVGRALGAGELAAIVGVKGRERPCVALNHVEDLPRVGVVGNCAHYLRCLFNPVGPLGVLGSVIAEALAQSACRPPAELHDVGRFDAIAHQENDIERKVLCLAGHFVGGGCCKRCNNRGSVLCQFLSEGICNVPADGPCVRVEQLGHLSLSYPDFFPVHIDCDGQAYQAI